MDLQQTELRKQGDKPHLILLTDPAEIASAFRNDLHDIIGAEIGGQWWAYSWSADHWRRAQSGASEAKAEGS